MRLDFNVLWVDDQPNAVTAQITGIKRRMIEEGFNFNPTSCRSIDEVKKLIAGDVFKDEVDLILVDWDLGGGVQGQDVIKRIRQVAQYKDIIFYSAQTRVQELRRQAFEKQLEGIYCTTREELVDEVLGVFESLVKKVLDLDHTRGIVMGATSDIDHMVKSCLLRIEAKQDDTGKIDLLNQAIKRVQKRVKNIDEQGKKLESATDLETILNAHMIFSANDCLRMLYRLLKNDNNTTYAQAADTINSYMNNVIPDRNKLGHMHLTPTGRPQAVVNIKGESINLDDMRTLRKTILGSREEFRTLVEELKKT